MYNASQFGQLNRFTGDFGIGRPISKAAGTSLVRIWPQATFIELMDGRWITQRTNCPLYFQTARDHPVTLPVEACEML
jgi:hypothetical protein